MLGVDGVGDRRSQAILARNFSAEKLGKAKKKEKEHTRKKKEHTTKKRDDIRTAELNRRDQVTATVPGPVSFERGNRGRLSGSSTYCIGNAHHAPSENRSTKSADGRMATEAARLERKESTERKREKREKHT